MPKSSIFWMPNKTPANPFCYWMTFIFIFIQPPAIITQNIYIKMNDNNFDKTTWSTKGFTKRFKNVIDNWRTYSVYLPSYFHKLKSILRNTRNNVVLPPPKELDAKHLRSICRCIRWHKIIFMSIDLMTINQAYLINVFWDACSLKYFRMEYIPR